MADDERQVWYEVAASAVAMGVLTPADAVAFEILVRAIARYRRGMAQVLIEGEVIKCGKIKMKSPWLSVVKDAEAIINTYGAKFGLTPADRSRIVLPEGQKEEDPLEALINRGRKQIA